MNKRSEVGWEFKLRFTYCQGWEDSLRSSSPVILNAFQKSWSYACPLPKRKFLGETQIKKQINAERYLYKSVLSAQWENSYQAWGWWAHFGLLTLRTRVMVDSPPRFNSLSGLGCRASGKPWLTQISSYKRDQLLALCFVISEYSSDEEKAGVALTWLWTNKSMLRRLPRVNSKNSKVSEHIFITIWHFLTNQC